MSAGPSASEGDGADCEPIDPSLAEAVESAFDGVDLDTAPSGTARAAGDDEGAGRLEQEAQDQPDPLAEARAESARLTDELARARADLYNLQQEYQGFVRRSRESVAAYQEAGAAGVVEALIPVLDEAELARQHGDLTGPFETTVTKLETILGDKFALERFGAVGETFDPTIHEALMAVESTEVDEPTIALVLQPGYRLGERVVRPARVQVSNPA
ncbi:nucleotide exchange factor GrpE [Actinomyces gaoshouyii]|uniref:nucleotide exchange factor GrpE n=1 Tax=Actinomyces gaoshouyii TaxID=1960083 RepID=UPI0009C15A28|nr:nucleotide exchange factor GrpE [Actinomyces gaoshouyii]ARD41065.1 nucleotide exchange factor GrpE [Actinomyces gaoshouyii]